MGHFWMSLVMAPTTVNAATHIIGIKVPPNSPCAQALGGTNVVATLLRCRSSTVYSDQHVTFSIGRRDCCGWGVAAMYLWPRSRVAHDQSLFSLNANQCWNGSSWWRCWIIVQHMHYTEQYRGGSSNYCLQPPNYGIRAHRSTSAEGFTLESSATSGRHHAGSMHG